ncbi:spore germination protein [Ectobacillus antri]|uniref:Spore germination protein n=1 Tax=Ectobacillus antri TaxID=2486280 RepID=A0ABT6H127_9BACI|nr:spore germination protein [Ectobacillus antri]MDG4655987.1 spore germination protein [Ectobacillus antri]MDG5752662.1 spore germination protein [Ectobacillus antri]
METSSQWSEIQGMKKKLSRSYDFVNYRNKEAILPYSISYFSSLINIDTLHREMLPAMNQQGLLSIQDLKGAIPIEDSIITTDKTIIEERLLNGYVLIELLHDKTNVLLIKATVRKSRNISAPENEFTVMGPKEALIEDLDTNIHLIRKRLPIPGFITIEMKIGTMSQTRVSILYIEHVTDDDNINTILKRIQDIQYDAISDVAVLNQMIVDDSLSIFPQTVDTERVDRIVGALSDGYVVIMCDGSSSAIIAPATLGILLTSFEDYYLNWILASFFRIVRVISIFLSVIVTPLYVAILTYHYEIFPSKLLGTLISSRSSIPFPPIIEALFLEITIELLREAGARMPSKIGQTLGIVGGIVIGTASVQASLTSNVLLIIVALAALASFTTPVYQVTNTIRFLRYPFLLFAQFLGLFGIALFGIFVLTHLIKLTSFNRPYLSPIYPPRIPDMKDFLIRLPFGMQKYRPTFLRAKDKTRFSFFEGFHFRDFDDD